MRTDLIELIESLRKLSAENASPRDCIDEAADKLGALAAEVEHWRDEWSEVCNDNQILHNRLVNDDAILYQVLEALSACDIYAYAGGEGEGLMSTKHAGAEFAVEKLKAEIESLRADASRYRWLRDHAQDATIGVYADVWDDQKRNWINGKELDCVMNKAMKGETNADT